MLKYLLILCLNLAASLAYSQEIMLLQSDGKVIIGDPTQITTPGNYGLYVEHGILTERIKVSLKSSAEWSDNAWDRRPDLVQIQASIKNNKHLFDMPGVDKLLEEGYELKDMDAKLLAQIEWLWTYVIELEEKNNKLEKRLDAIEQSLLPTPNK